MGSKKRDVELRDFFDAKFADSDTLAHERDRRYEQRFNDSERRVLLALDAAEKAVLKAESANDKRFDSVNEFRKTLSDQTSSFVTREVFDAKFGTIERDVHLLQAARSEVIGATEARQQITATTLAWLGLVLVVLSILSGVAVRAILG